MDTMQLKGFCVVTTFPPKKSAGKVYSTGKYGLSFSTDKRILYIGKYVILSENKEIDIEYVFYYLCAHPEKLEKITNISYGKPLSIDAIQTIEVEVPDFTIQRKIIDIFSYLYKILEHRKDILAKFPDVIYNYYLTMINGVESRFWKEYSVSDLSEKIKSGASNHGISKKALGNDGDYYVVGIDNIKHDIFEKTSSRYIKTPGHNLNSYRLEANDVIISIRGTVGHSAVMPQNLENAIAGPNVAFIKLKDNVNPYFFSYSLNHNPQVRTWVRNTGQRSVINSLNIGDIRNLKLKLPDKEVQNYFEEVFKAYSSAYSKMKHIETLLVALQSSLLHNIFISPNGMLRNGNADNDIAKFLRIVNGNLFHDRDNYDEIRDTLFGMLESGEVKQRFNPQTKSIYLEKA